MNKDLQMARIDKNKQIVGVTLDLCKGDYDKMLKAGVSIKLAEEVQTRAICNIVSNALKMPGEGVEKFDNLLKQKENENANISEDIKITYNGKYKLKYK